MKKTFLSPLLLTAVIFCACNNNNEPGTASDSTTSTSTNTATTTPTDTGTGMANRTDTSNTATMNTTATTTTANLDPADRKFVLEAAKGGMMEVDAGNMAQQKATNPRVKDFGSMMVRDHSKANDELKSLAASKGLNIPTDSLQNANKKHLDQMQSMQPKAFQDHYASMMVSDHKKDVSEFEKEANQAKDPDLKAWVSKTLPVLKMHLDSAQAINKAVH